MNEGKFESGSGGIEELLSKRDELQRQIETIEERHREPVQFPSNKQISHLEAFDYARRENILKEIAELDEQIDSFTKDQAA